MVVVGGNVVGGSVVGGNVVVVGGNVVVGTVEDDTVEPIVVAAPVTVGSGAALAWEHAASKATDSATWPHLTNPPLVARMHAEYRNLPTPSPPCPAGDGRGHGPRARPRPSAEAGRLTTAVLPERDFVPLTRRPTSAPTEGATRRRP